MTMTKDEAHARIAKMIPGGLLSEFMSYDHIVELMIVTQVITNLCLNEIEERGELTSHNDGRVIVPDDTDFVVETILTEASSHHADSIADLSGVFQMSSNRFVNLL